MNGGASVAVTTQYLVKGHTCLLTFCHFRLNNETN